MGVISPIGLGIDTFTEAMYAGTCGLSLIDRFDTTDYKVKVAGQVRGFAPESFGIERGDARRMDLYTQYAMAAAAQAMAQSGIEGQVDPDRLGVYVGSGIGGMHTFSQETEKLLTRGPGRVSPLFIPMMIANIASGNIAIRWHAQGPCLPVVTACATSTNAIGEAFRAIGGGYADAIIAGGAEAAIEPLAIAGFTSCKALSESDDPNAASLPFDSRRAGFVMGEGAGVLVLEELEHAKARGANILGEIVGYANTCDAYHITAPHPEGEGGARAVKLAAREAGMTDADVVYVNAHGTGTPMNDRIETMVLKKALGEDGARKAYISSTKAMTGHMLGAAGGVECIASAIALANGRLPGTIHLDNPDPECDLNYLPGAAQDVKATLALSVSLGFGGHNGVLALRRYV